MCIIREAAEWADDKKMVMRSLFTTAAQKHLLRRDVESAIELSESTIKMNENKA